MDDGLTYTTVTASEQETQKLAGSLAPYLRAGDVVVLSGELGAGKTQFVKGVARALGVSEPVTSPSFNILLDYLGSAGLPLFHFDLYRLDFAYQLEDIGYFEVVDGPGVTFIEWGEKFPEELPQDYLELRLEQGRGQAQGQAQADASVGAQAEVLVGAQAQGQAEVSAEASFDARIVFARAFGERSHDLLACWAGDSASQLVAL